MNWNDHSRDGLSDHAILNPSGYSWINYDQKDMAEKLTKRYCAVMRAPAGTAIHDFAKHCISRKIKIPKQINNVIKMVQLFMSDSKSNYSDELINFIPNLPSHTFESLILYVNDCIGFGMDPEVKLVYSESCFGTADAISFENNILRISDYKSGDGPGHMEQLLIYDALFCLEYHFQPDKLIFENRIYQFGDVTEAIDIPSEVILTIMQVLTTESKFVQQLRGKE
jgi:hypothetical protein